MKLEKQLPCGEIILSKEVEGRREYYLELTNDVTIPLWKPKEVHRVALQAAILIEDEYKYSESTELTTREISW